jgi:hypothetical protein
VVDSPVDREIRNRGVEKRWSAIDTNRDDRSVKNSDWVIQTPSTNERRAIWVEILVGNQVIRSGTSSTLVKVANVEKSSLRISVVHTRISDLAGRRKNVSSWTPCVVDGKVGQG